MDQQRRVKGEYIKMDDEIYHHGIKGQRWGVRRFQNEDGSLTNAGRERYSSGATRSYERKAAKYASSNPRKSNIMAIRAIDWGRSLYV